MGRNKKRADGTYRFVRYINGKRIEATGGTEKKAKENLDRKIEEYKKGKGKPVNEYTLDEYYTQKWFPKREKEVQINLVRSATVRKQSFQYEDISKIVIEKVYHADMKRPPVSMRFVDIRLEDITKEDVEKLQYALRTATIVRKGKKEPEVKYKISSVNDTIFFLKHILNGAVDDGYIQGNPASRVKAIPNDNKAQAANKTIHRGLSLEEQEKFFSEAVNSWYYPLYVFMISSGIRLGEAAALKWSDLNPKKGIVEISKTYTKNEAGAYYIGNPKTKAGNRSVEYLDLMKNAVQAQKVRNEIVFGNEITSLDGFIFLSPMGQIVRASGVNRDMEQICKRAGIKRLTSHGLRDSYSTRFLESGGSMKTLQVNLGHDHFVTTSDTYAHVTDETRAKESRAVDIGISFSDSFKIS